MTLGTHVHHPLAHWAHTRPHAVALASESQCLTFADLHARVQQRAAQLAAAQAPATVLLPGTGGVVHTLVEFLAVLTAGRCAAVGDPAWPAPIAQSVQAAIAALPPLVPPPAPGQEPFYIGFTSGSSGMPKGFRRHHQSWVESFRVSQHDFGEAMAGRIVAPGSLTASLFLFGALLGLWTGAGSVVQEHFSAERTLRDLASVAPQLARSMGYDAGAYSRGACDVGAARSGGRNHVSPPLVGKYVPFSPDLPVNVYMNRSGQPVRATMGQCDNAFSGRLPRPVNGIPQPPPPPPPPPAPPPMVCECWTDAYATQQGGACAPGQMVCRPAGQRSIIPTPVYRGPNDPR